MGRNYTYTTSKVIEMIRGYRANVNAVRELQKQYMYDVSIGLVAQGGIESSMPKAAYGHSDTVYSEVKQIMDNNQMISELENKIRFVEHRWHRITKDKHAMVFALVIQGYSYEKTAMIAEMSKVRVHQILKECALQLLESELSTEKLNKLNKL